MCVCVCVGFGGDKWKEFILSHKIYKVTKT